MNRIRKVYEARYRALLHDLNARRPEQGVGWLVARAEQLCQSSGVSPTHALAGLHERLRRTTDAFAGRTGRRPAALGPQTHDGHPPRRFICDAGLGGLARWLRAAGYESIWITDIEDGELVRQAAQVRATILTTDSLMMERGVLRDGIIPAFWLPPTLKIDEQLALVFGHFHLTVRDPRCTRCGGELRQVDKESMRERIPPRTAHWLDDYFVCSRCAHLFWRGTHWRNIRSRLEKLSAA